MPYPAHIQWLFSNRGPRLRAVLERQGLELELHAAIDVLMAADPSPSKHAVQWLCDALIGGGMLWEDVAGGADSKAGETLGWFAQHRRALPVGSRNLEDHAGLGRLYQAMAPLLEVHAPHGPQSAHAEPTGRALRRAQRLEAREQSIIVHQSPELIVAVPLTQIAAKWWRRGTRWCTAAEQSNMFDRYNQVAPLLVLVLPTALHPNDNTRHLYGDAEPHSGAVLGTKLQLHLGPDGGVHFMDSADAPVDSEFIGRHWSVLGPLVSWVLSRGGDITPSVPRAALHGDIARMAVEIKSSYLSAIPIEHRTADICRIAVEGNCTVLGLVPPAVMDAGMCATAVGTRPQALTHVRADLVTPELCMLAAQGGLSSLGIVPPQFWSPELLRAALDANGRLLRNVPMHMRTPELYRAAVANNGFSLAYVPKELRTPELCLLAVQNDGRALGHVEVDMWTDELLMAAIQNNPRAASIIDNHMPERLGDAMLELCVSAHLDGFEDVPVGRRTRALSLRAIEVHGHMLAKVPAHLLDAQLCARAVANCARALACVPHHLQTRSMCMAAIERAPSLISRVAPDLLDQDMYRLAIQGNPRLILGMPAGMVTPDMLVDAVAKNPGLISFLEDKQTLELCMTAVRANRGALRYVAAHLRQEVDQALEALPPEPSKAPMMPRWLAETALAGLRECLGRPAPALLGRDIPASASHVVFEGDDREALTP